MNAPRQGAPKFAGVAYDEALRRARELVPRLRERAAEAENARVMPPETLRDLHAAGLIRTLQPRRWGGMEFDFIAYVDFPLELARGCPSTAWNLANLQVHHWMLAMYDERAQEEVWGRDPEAMIASGIAYPQGRGTRVDGGFLISGRWNFSSCVNVSDWSMLAVTVREGERAVDHRMCLLHKSQYGIVDDWQVLGMRATGSMTVVANDVFVPEYKALCMYEARGGDRFPGARTNPHPVYRVPLSSLGGHGIGACAVGNAQAALDHT
ncbi:MAG TPA: acyl-CoA dehydrogenase family protein, partial [Burkholderiales bacterium]|nr:acyl-CoA dehydrogenase family protein [Burkholderiales bacterium]